MHLRTGCTSAGIEVLMDVGFNDTDEGNRNELILSVRGFTVHCLRQYALGMPAKCFWSDLALSGAQASNLWDPTNVYQATSDVDYIIAGPLSIPLPGQVWLRTERQSFQYLEAGSEDDYYGR